MNSSPVVMFEFMAINQQRLIAFYTQLFGWTVEYGTDNFAYIKFPGTYAALGGIGQAQVGIPGMQKHATFYIQVDDLAATLERVVALGGAKLIDPVAVDGYEFAMFEDPEFNIVGIIKPFRPG